MSLCDNCIHDDVCGTEGHCDEGLIFCADMIPKTHWIPTSERLPEELEHLYEAENNALEKAVERIEDLPPVIPSRPTGYWIFEKGDGKTCVDGYACSACNKSFHTHVPYFAEYKYCPNCGCRMIEPQESEEQI